MEFLIWGALPYAVAVMLISGLIWRYRYDQFGWTTRSSELLESKVLKVASPLFHFAILVVLMGHLVGLLIPMAVTNWLGIDNHDYHRGALIGGGFAGICLVVGLVLLLWRRSTKGAVLRATTTNDKIMYLVLATVIGLGLVATLTGGIGPGGEEHNYRETVSVWFRSLLMFHPDVAAMQAATWQFKVHVLMGLTLFAILPFTRLVHSFTAPLHYLFRPYIVYRSRGDGKTLSRTARGRGWDPVGTPDNARGRR